jgi:hypothetical protein
MAESGQKGGSDFRNNHGAFFPGKNGFPRHFAID